MLINHRWRRFRQLARLIPTSIVISIAAFGVSATQFFLDKIYKTRSLLVFTNSQWIELNWKDGSPEGPKATSTLKLTLINNGNQPASFAKADLVLGFPQKGSASRSCTTAFQNPFQIAIDKPFETGAGLHIPYDFRPKVVKPGEIEVIEGSASWQPQIKVDPSQRQQTTACLAVWAIDSAGNAFTFLDQRSIYHFITTGDHTGSPGMAYPDYKVIDILKTGRRFDTPK